MRNIPGLFLKIISTLMPVQKRSGVLGVSKKKRDYDIPLHKKMGSEFLTLLIGLMTFLAILALTGSFILSSLTERWTSGLRNEMTIEIPAETDKGEILSLQKVSRLAEKTADQIRQIEFVSGARALSEKEIEELLAPWLGENTNLEEIPLPGLIAVTIEDDMKPDTALIEKQARTIAPLARLNTHKKWLNDIVKFADALKLASMLIAAVIAFTTFAAVAGAIRSRIATHYEELELLHLMGASDGYISKQFQRHAFILSLKGALGGLLAAFFFLFIVTYFTGDVTKSVLPQFELGTIHYLIFLCVPIFVGLIAVLTARRVALKELSQMP